MPLLPFLPSPARAKRLTHSLIHALFDHSLFQSFSKPLSLYNNYYYYYYHHYHYHPLCDIRLSSHSTLITRPTKQASFELISSATITTAFVAEKASRTIYRAPSIIPPTTTQDKASQPRATTSETKHLTHKASSQDLPRAKLPSSSNIHPLHRTTSSTAQTHGPSVRAQNFIQILQKQAQRTTKAFARATETRPPRCANQPFSPSSSPPLLRTRPPST